MSATRYTRKHHRATDVGDGVLLLEFNRAPVNAINEELWAELRDIMESISNDPEVHVVVLSSALDKIWTVGLDLASLGQLHAKATDGARKALQLRDHILDYQDAITSLERCHKPVIAAMHGTAVGMAIDMSTACDIRIASSDVRFAIGVKVGFAADIGTLQRLPKIIGSDSKARELALTGRFFDAAEAHEIGFISHVAQGGRKQVTEQAIAMAKQISVHSPVAVLGTKHLMNHSRDNTVEDGLAYAALWNSATLQTPDVAAAMKAVLAKKTTTYKPLSKYHGPPRSKL